MYRSILRQAALIAILVPLFMAPAQPIVAEEFEIILLAKPSGKYKKPATIALVACGYTEGLQPGMMGTFYKLRDTSDATSAPTKVIQVEVQDVTAYTSSCLIPGIKLEEIKSNCVVDLDLPTMTAQDYQLIAGKAVSDGDYEKASIMLDHLVRMDSASVDSSVQNLLTWSRSQTDSAFTRNLSRKERKIEKKRASIYHQLGAFFFSDGDHEAAKYYLKRTIRGDKKHEHAQKLLCIIEEGAPCLSTDPSVFVPVEIYPEMIYAHTPDYPRVAKQAGITGEVWVKSLLDASGLVVKAMVAKSSGSMALDMAAVQAAYGCKFKPGIQGGKPVHCWVSYKVDFVLD